MGLRGRKPKTLEEVVEIIQDNSYINEDTGCYIWTGSTNDHGYGIIRCESKAWLIHRLIFIRVEPCKPAVIVCHTCDERDCWNPEHLYAGTTQSNVADMVERNRQHRGNDHYRAVLNEDLVREIRASTASNQELAAKLNIDYTAIHRARIGATWKHVK